MDLKNWKKLEEKSDAVTLIHPKGHTMTIAVKALPKIQREAIKRLEFWDGGNVNSDSSDTGRPLSGQSDQQNQSEAAKGSQKGGTPSDSPLATGDWSHLWKSNGGRVESNDHLDSGEDGTSEQGRDVRMAKKARARDEKSEAREHEEMAKDEARGRRQMEKTVKPKMKGLANGGRVKYADGSEDVGMDGSVDQKADDGGAGGDQSTPTNHVPINVNVFAAGTPGGGAMPAGQMPAPTTQGPVGAAIPMNAKPIAESPVPQVEPKPADAGPDMLAQDNALNAPAAARLQQRAIREQQAVDSEKSDRMAQAEQERLSSEGAIAQNIRNNFRELKDHTDDFAAYSRQNRINPNAYAENMGSGQKVATAIGLFLGGFKQGFAGGSNPAMDFLNTQIDRDIKGQQQRFENEKTVFGAYRDLYHDSNIATNLAKVSANDMLTHRTNLIAAQMGTAQAKAGADALSAQKAIENNQLLLDSAGRLGTLRMGAGGGGPKTEGAEGAQNETQQPGAGGKGKGAKNWYDTHILSPTADRDFLSLQFNPVYKNNLSAILEQKQKADLADKAIQTVIQRFPQITGTVGESSYARNHLMPFMGSIPIAGGPLGNTVRTFTDNPSTRQYDTHRSAIVGSVRGALQGNVSDQLLDDTVNSNLPEKGDKPQDVERKMKTLVEFIKSHTRTDLLRSARLSRE